MNYTGRYKNDVPARSIKLAETLPKYNGLAYLNVKSDNHATHWMPLIDKNNDQSGVTIGKLYRLYLDEYEKDHIIVTDSNELSTLHLCHSGHFIILQDSQQWWNYVERLWLNEWYQTVEFQQIMKESMEFKRRAQERD